MARFTVKFGRGGQFRVDIDHPDRERCHQIDREFRAVVGALGLRIEDTQEVEAEPVPDGVPIPEAVEN